MIEALSNFHFIRPFFLLLLPVGGGLWWWWRQGSDPQRGWREQMDAPLLEALAGGGQSARPMRGFGLLAGWILAIVAVAGPTWRPEPNPFADDATPLMILLKADAGMDRPDPAPSRLERAKLKIADLAEARKGQPLGLIVYAGSAHLVLPPTRDTAVVAEMAAEITTDLMPRPGDRLDLALKKAGEVLDEGGHGGTLLVLADAVEGTMADIVEAHRTGGRNPIHFLAIQSPEAPLAESLRQTARALKGSVESLSVNDDDIRTLVRLAARSPLSREGEGGIRWQEAGYYLVPWLGLIVLASFRREFTKTEGRA